MLIFNEFDYMPRHISEIEIPIFAFIGASMRGKQR